MADPSVLISLASVRRRLPAIAALLAVVVVAGCSSSPTTPTPAPTPIPTPTPTPTPPPPVPEPPTVTCPAPITVTATSSAGAVVTFATPAVTGGESPVVVACTPGSGSTFGVGTSTVQCTATDNRSRSASCSFAVTVTPAPRISKAHFMAFGDSITSGEVTFPVNGVAPTLDGFPAFRLILVPSAAYPTVVNDLLVARYTTQSGSFRVENQGKPGERTQDAVPRFMQVYGATRPEVLLLMEGYNDIHTDESGAASRAATALNQMATEARNRGTRVFIATLAPSRPGGRSTIPTPLIDDFNRRVRSVAAGEGAVLVDIYGALIGDVDTYIGLDGLHPTEIGYRKIGETFFAAVRADLEVR